MTMATIALSAPQAFAQRNAPPTAGKKAPQTFNIVPITIQNVTVQDGQLVALGSIGVNQIVLPITLTPQPLVPGAECPILDLSLGPINLSLLGLNVDTSPICLEITATPGGGLLGDLLCGIANLLNQGVPLATVLNGLTPAQLGTLDRGLTTVLNEVLGLATSSDALAGSTCSILSLAVGPLDLTLLGLNVRLDDCSNGPVTVDITATPGGGLLGDLLCSLTDLLNNNQASTNAVLTLLRNIARVIGGLVG
jgi:hypothetical protein